jgi:hypothetical protein
VTWKWQSSLFPSASEGRGQVVLATGGNTTKPHTFIVTQANLTPLGAAASTTLLVPSAKRHVIGQQAVDAEYF